MLFAEFHAPLVKGVDVPHHALHESDVLVERDECAQRKRGEFLGEDGGGGAVAGHDFVVDQVHRHAFVGDFYRVFAKCEDFSLREEVAHEQVVHAACAVGGCQIGFRPGKPDEVGGDEPGSLVHELEEGVLPVGPRFAPVDFASVAGDDGSVVADGFAVGFHGELLQIGGEACEVLGVRQHSVGLCVEEVGVPDSQ